MKIEIKRTAEQILLTKKQRNCPYTNKYGKNSDNVREPNALTRRLKPKRDNK